jgi:hypothetical protein
MSDFQQLFSQFNNKLSEEEEAPVQTTDFGLPLHLNNLDVLPSNEFESTGAEVNRGIEVLDFPSNDNSFNNLEFGTSLVGSSFVASQNLFASEPQAPVLPFYFRPSRTSFVTSMSLKTIRRKIELALHSCDSLFTEEDACVYRCSVREQFEFEIRIFSSVSGSFLVNVQFIDGCRFSFSSFTQSFSKAINIAWFEERKAVPMTAPSFSDDLPMPVLVSCQ